MKRSSWLFAAAAASVLFAGCSGERVTKVLVALKMDDKPLTDAEVRLVPKDDPNLGDGCSGKTAADGKVELLPNPKRPMKAGRYVALVKKLVRKDGSPFTLDEDIAVRASVMEKMAAQNLVPAVYGDKERSPLIVTLTGGENTVPLELNSKQK